VIKIFHDFKFQQEKFRRPAKSFNSRDSNVLEYFTYTEVVKYLSLKIFRDMSVKGASGLMNIV